MNDYVASVTFEFDVRPVETVRLTVSANTWSIAFRKAAKAAQRAHPGLKPRSIVVVLEKAEPAVTAAASAAA